MTHPVVEAVARVILRTRLDQTKYDDEFIDENWHKFVDEAKAALQAIEPLLAEAFEEGQNALPGSLAGYQQHTDYAKRIIHELTEQEHKK